MNGHCKHLALKFSVRVKERQERLPTMYWLPKFHKKNHKISSFKSNENTHKKEDKEIPYKAQFIANSSICTTTELSKLLTSCLTASKIMS